MTGTSKFRLLALVTLTALASPVPAAESSLGSLAGGPKRTKPDARVKDFLAMRAWREAEGEGVVLHYVARNGVNPPADVQEKVEGFDWALREVHRVLAVPPLPFKVRVFLFPDAASIGTDGGLAQRTSVAIVDGVWPDRLRCLAVHELAHVVSRHHFAPGVPSLLSEGIAVYVQNAVPETAFVNLGLGLAPPGITTDETIPRLLELHGRQLPYPHAGDLVAFLIERGGPEAFETFCRTLSLSSDPDWTARMESATLDVYGVSLPQLEAEWRSSRSE